MEQKKSDILLYPDFFFIKIPGCFLPASGVCYIPWKGSALVRKDYELLCRKETRIDKSFFNKPAVQFDESLKVMSFRNPLKPYTS